MTNTIQVLNNGNSIKDELFQKLCNKTSFTQKIHQSISRGFDKISKHTVLSKYKSVSNQMNTLDAIMRNYKDRLSPADRVLFEQKLKEIDKLQEFFSTAQAKNRLEHQETLMQNLEKEVSVKIKQAKDTVWGAIKGKKPDDGMKLKDTYTFWAEDALMKERNRIEEEGLNVIHSLVGDGKTQKGAYHEMVDLLARKLSPEEKRAFEDSIQQAEKLLKKANSTECVEYFDKKRDLVLGSAPTDVLTALASLIASGIAIGVADTKEDRLSRTISGALPVIAGLGVSTALTAMLFSGGKGMLLGTGSGMILSALGSAASRRIFPKDQQETIMAENTQNITKEGEVKNA